MRTGIEHDLDEKRKALKHLILADKKAKLGKKGFERPGFISMDIRRLNG